MVKDRQIKELFMLRPERPLNMAAKKAGLCENTARKYLKLRKLPSQLKKERTYRTRPNPFEEIEDEIKQLALNHPDLQAKTLIQHLREKYPGKFLSNQLRTLQRIIKRFRVLEGKSKEVFFPQTHYPGKLCESDFCNMNSLGITINKQRFSHLLYHFVLTYSNWETGNSCDTESYESLIEGFQKALWQLGGVPSSHRTDNLSAATKKTKGSRTFIARYNSVLAYYNINGERTQVESPNENGDIEQRHHRLKQLINQDLILRGNRDFGSKEDYDTFINNIFVKVNSERNEKLVEEKNHLKPLPKSVLDIRSRFKVRVNNYSTTRVQNNTYSVNSSFIGENVIVYLSTNTLEVWYTQKLIDTIPRLKGTDKHRINYRHIISWLIRKPGAFENYKYREDLFPTTHFRLVYDILRKDRPLQSVKEYLKILYIAKMEGESKVEETLKFLIKNEHPISFFIVEKLVKSIDNVPSQIELSIPIPDLNSYNDLLKDFTEGGYADAS